MSRRTNIVRVVVIVAVLVATGGVLRMESSNCCS